MDLHDYKDVAENYDLYLDVMYKDVDNHSGFQDFYLDFAKEYGKDGVIDIACGTGAVIEERVRPLKMRQTYRQEWSLPQPIHQADRRDGRSEKNRNRSRAEGSPDQWFSPNRDL